MSTDLSNLPLPEWIDSCSIKKIASPFEQAKSNYLALAHGNEEVFISKFLAGRESSYDREKRCLLALKGKWVPRLIFFDDKNCILIREYIRGTQLLTVCPPTQLIEQRFDAYANTTNLISTKKLNHLNIIPDLDLAVLALLSSSERRHLPRMLGLLASGHQVPCHRDFKPQNIIVSQAGAVSMIDFEHYHNDNLAVDVARFYLGSSLSWSIATQVDLIDRFCQCLEKTVGFSLRPAELIAGAYC